jgi:hypothetical protein
MANKMDAKKLKRIDRLLEEHAARWPPFRHNAFHCTEVPVFVHRAV